MTMCLGASVNRFCFCSRRRKNNSGDQEHTPVLRQSQSNMAGDWEGSIPTQRSPSAICQTQIKPKSWYAKVPARGTLHGRLSVGLQRGGAGCLLSQADLVHQYQGPGECRLQVESKQPPSQEHGCIEEAHWNISSCCLALLVGNRGEWKGTSGLQSTPHTGTFFPSPRPFSFHSY